MDSSICVIGLGYIGLPTALLFAASGKIVHGFDVSQDKIKLLKAGKLPFAEPGLRELYIKAKKNGSFIPSNTIASTDCYIIAVPTPQTNHAADLTYVLQALQSLIPFIRKSTLIVLESTISPSDCDSHIIPFLEKYGKFNVALAHCPERAIPGNTIHEMQYNSRVVGGKTSEVAERVKRLYLSFVKADIHTTNLITAAACKVMENTYRDVNIALANEFAKIADDLKFNVWEAITLANLHPRVNIHQPGPGVGGHCIAVDPWYFVGESKQARLITKARGINDDMPEYVAHHVSKIAKKYHLSSPIIGVLGYAYKKNVDDARETPIEPLLKILEKKYSCIVHDPYVDFKSRQSIELEQLLNKSQVIVLTTNHDIYKNIDFRNYPNIIAIYDLRNAVRNSQVNKTFTALYKLGDGRL
ncbi:MAG: nucleotide sugar dehydrogenase [Candidatus Pacebacteria bacterium]|nr:nucleotide sugar dehydrogenase [Candidatus Paceibacterota bacterium]